MEASLDVAECQNHCLQELFWDDVGPHPGSSGARTGSVWGLKGRVLSGSLAGCALPSQSTVIHAMNTH